MKNKKKQLKKIADGRTYKILTTIDADPYPYSEECWRKHRRRCFESKQGSKNYFSWKRKVIFQFQYREYRTWKYNRKTRWK